MWKIYVCIESLLSLDFRYLDDIVSLDEKILLSFEQFSSNFIRDLTAAKRRFYDIVKYNMCTC